MFGNGKLFRALVNPRADEADLVVSKFFGALPLGHELIRIVSDVRHIRDQTAFGAVAGNNHHTVLFAFERACKAVECEAGFGFLPRSVAFDAIAVSYTHLP